MCIAVVLYNFYSQCFEFGIEVNNKWLFFVQSSIYFPACVIIYLCVFGSCKKKEKKSKSCCVFFFFFPGLKLVLIKSFKSSLIPV